MGIIYILENKTNGKCYIGQTTQKFSKRFNRHKISSTPIGNAIRKYGIDSFNKIIIEDIPEEKLDELEKGYIEKYNSVYPNGYNLDDGGNSNKHHNEETKKKLSSVVFTEERKKKIKEARENQIPPMRGRHHTKETKEIIKLKLIGNDNALGVKRSEENRKKISEGHKGQIPWNKGKTGVYTQETLEKMGRASKGRVPWNKGKISITEK